MGELRYPAKRFAELLRLTPTQLERNPKLRSLTSAGPANKKNGYLAADLPKARALLGEQPRHVPQRRQLFLNFKGGTGKTSVSTAYAYRLWELGYRVLVIDLDSQGHATKCLGLEGSDFPKTLYDVLIRRVPFKEVIVDTGLPGLSLVPSNLGMSTIELALMPLAGREFKLRSALKEVEGEYDFTVLDAPPSFGLLNLNALMAANDLVVPVLADFLSFHGLKLLFETVQSLEDDLGHVLDHIFIAINAFNQTFKLAKEAREALNEHYKEFLLKSVIRQCTKFAQASSEGRPIFVVDAASKGAVDIAALTQELVTAAAKSPPSALVGPGERSGVTGGGETHSGHRASQTVGPTESRTMGRPAEQTVAVGVGAKDKSAVA
jgi:chromosome partitioning protein